MKENRLAPIEKTNSTAPQFQGRRHLSRSGIAGILTGIGFLTSALGLFVYAMSMSALIYLLFSILTALIGYVLLQSGMNTVTGNPFRPMYRRGRSIRPGGSGVTYLDSEAHREEEEERKRETGEAD